MKFFNRLQQICGRVADLFFVFNTKSVVLVFTADATQSTILLWQASRLSVPDVEVSLSYRLKLFENNFTVRLPVVFALLSEPNITDIL